MSPKSNRSKGSYPTENPPDAPFCGGGSQSEVYPASAISGILRSISRHEVLKYCRIVSRPNATDASRERRDAKTGVGNDFRCMGGETPTLTPEPACATRQI